MMSTVFLIMMGVAVISAQNCVRTPGFCPQVPVDRQFQISKLEGTSYLVATSYEGNQDSCVKYQLTRSRHQELTGTKSFRNSRNGQSENRPGSIRLKATGVLVVYFNEPHSQDTPEHHEVLLHDDDFVVLYGCTYNRDSDRSCLDILVFSKQQEISSFALNGVLKKLKDHGVNISNLNFVKQNQC